MAQVVKIDSNATKLYWGEELSLETDPTTWNEAEPNSFSDFGMQTTLVPREPIASHRQRKKGVLTDIDASGGFQTDLTDENLIKLMQGFFQATLRKKDELAVAVIDGPNNEFEPTSGGTGYRVNDLLHAVGFDAAANNGLHKVTGSVTATQIPVTTDLTAATAQLGYIRRVGHEFASGDATIDAAGTWPALVTSAKDLTQLGLFVGEWVYIGDGSNAAFSFANATNNGWVRVRSIAALRVEFDKASGVMVTDAGAGKTIRIFFSARQLKNESDPTLIVRRSYSLERQLGAPNDSTPTAYQAEYLVGAVPSTAQFNVNTADKVTADLEFVATDHETVTEATGPRSAQAFAEAAAIQIDDPAGTPVFTNDTTDFNDADANDVAVWPATEAAGDQFVIGYATPFTRVRLNIGTAGVGGTMVLKYWNGSAWSPLQRVSDGTNHLLNSGTREITFDQPSDWAASTINSQGPYYYIALEVLAATYSTIPLITQGWVMGRQIAVTEANAYNTSSHVKRLRMYALVAGDEFPSALFTYLQELQLTIDNNLDPAKAVSVLGAFDIVSGKFMVSGSAQAYFANVAQMAALRNNLDVTLDMVMVQDNRGLVFDIPVAALGDGRPNVESDAPILTPLTIEAAAGAKWNTDMNHTMLLAWFDYLPDVAE